MKRTLTVDLWIEDGNAMAEFYEGETGEHLGVVVPFSPSDHAEFDRQVGAELYSWLTMMADELAEQEDEHED